MDLIALKAEMKSCGMMTTYKVSRWQGRAGYDGEKKLLAKIVAWQILCLAAMAPFVCFSWTLQTFTFNTKK